MKGNCICQRFSRVPQCVSLLVWSERKLTACCVTEG